MLHVGIRPGEDQVLAFLVGPPDEIGRLTVRTADLHDLAQTIRLGKMPATDDETVPDCCLHNDLQLPDPREFPDPRNLQLPDPTLSTRSMPSPAIARQATRDGADAPPVRTIVQPLAAAEELRQARQVSIRPRQVE